MSHDIAPVIRGLFRSLRTPGFVNFRSFGSSRSKPVSCAILARSSCHRLFHTGLPALGIRVIKVPPFAESVTEGDIVWKSAIGDVVKEDVVVAEIETDKTNVPVPAPCTGKVTELLVEDGSRVVPGQEILKLDDDVSVSASTEAQKAAIEGPQQATSESKSADPVSVTTQSPQPPSSPSPVVPDQLLQQIPPIPVPDALKFDQVRTAAMSQTSDGRGEQRVKMSRMRLRIAQRLKDAQNTCAMLTTFNEIDMSNLLDLRRQYKDAFLKRHGCKLGIMSTFALASAVALQDQPAVNAVIDGNDIVYRDYIDISIAVATPKGLVVPVLRNVEKMRYADIEKEIINLGVKARDGKLAVEDMDGGTFTISNGGVYGSLFGTPIINPPQSAILGVYGVFDRPVARDGQVVIRPMMYAALTYDHRLIDGREAVLFLRKVKEFIEDPRSYFLQL